MSPVPDLSLAQLRCFLAVIDAGSFAEAARRMGISISAVSRLIGRFEAAHGLKLLHRSTHALSLTEEGQRLIDPAREAVRSLLELEGALGKAAREGDAGWVRITAPVAFLRHCLVPLLRRFSDEHPDIRLDLRSSNDLVDLADNGIDLALRSGALDTIPGHIQQKWFSFSWILCASPTYLAQAATEIKSPDDLPRHVLIGFRTTHNGMVRPWYLQDASSAETRRLLPDARFIFDDGEAGWQAAMDGAGIACAPMFLAADALASGAMIELLPEWRAVETPVAIVRRDMRLIPPRVDAVIAFLKRHPPRLKAE